MKMAITEEKYENFSKFFFLSPGSSSHNAAGVGGSVGGFSDRLSTAACGGTEYAAVHS